MRPLWKCKCFEAIDSTSNLYGAFRFSTIKFKMSFIINVVVRSNITNGVQFSALFLSKFFGHRKYAKMWERIHHLSLIPTAADDDDATQKMNDKFEKSSSSSSAPLTRRVEERDHFIWARMVSMCWRNVAGCCCCRFNFEIVSRHTHT